jgi:hypothetical protein
VPVPPAAVELLAALAPVLRRWGRWYVFGAQAAILYGVPRLSADVDVTLELVPDAPEAFAREMLEAGFTLRVTDPDFVRQTRIMPFVHNATSMAPSHLRAAARSAVAPVPGGAEVESSVLLSVRTELKLGAALGPDRAKARCCGRCRPS